MSFGHIAKRLLLSNLTVTDTINENNTGSNIAVQLLAKYGIDGNGCQNIYDIKYDQYSYPGISESNMFSTFISPVFLALKTNYRIVWQSDSPSSGVILLFLVLAVCERRSPSSKT